MTSREQARRIHHAERRWIADARVRLSRAAARRTASRPTRAPEEAPR